MKASVYRFARNPTPFFFLESDLDFESDADVGGLDGGGALSGVESGSNDESNIKVDGNRSRKNDLATLFDMVDSEVRWLLVCVLVF